MFDFKESIQEKRPPSNISQMLLALWYDGRGDWDKAHDVAQDIEGPDGSLIHAYLHRKEGDLWNAQYWYQKAGTKMPEASLEAEWSDLVKRYLS